MQMCPNPTCSHDNSDESRFCAVCGTQLRGLLGRGIMLQGRYQTERVLGCGGFGAVYMARDLRLNKQVALKQLFDSAAAALRQFEREARLLADLRHPGLPAVTDYFEDNSRFYLVMDYVPGETLSTLVSQQGPQPEARVMAWAYQVLDILRYLHGRQPPIIHRDIKPGNLRLAPDGSVVLVDFGISKEQSDGQTTIGARAVSPGYSPIEQYGNSSTDTRSDLYSLGATLYYLLTAQHPPEALRRIGTSDPLVPIHALAPATSQLSEQIVMRAMAPDVVQRFQSALEMRNAVEMALRAGDTAQPYVVAGGTAGITGRSGDVVSGARGAKTSPMAGQASGGRGGRSLLLVGIVAVLFLIFAGVFGVLGFRSVQNARNAESTATAATAQAVAVAERATATSEARATSRVQATRTANARDTSRAESATATAAAEQTEAANLPLVTSTPRPSSDVSQAYLFSFDDPDNPDGWLVGDYEGSTYELRDGQFFITCKRDNQIVWDYSLAKFNLSSFAASVDAQVLTPDGAADLIFNFQDNDNFYVFTVRNDGSYTLTAKDSGEWLEDALVPFTNSAAIRTGNAWNELKVVRQESQISLFVNDVKLTSVDDARFSGGSVGVAAESFATPTCQSVFDNLRIGASTLDVMEDSSNPSNWNLRSDEDADVALANGVLNFQVKRGDWRDFSGVSIDLPRNFSIDLDLASTAAPEAISGGVFFNYDSSNDSYYLVEIWSSDGASGQFTLRRYVNNESTDIVAWTESNAIRTGTNTNHIRVVRSENNIELFINGTLVYTYDGADLNGSNHGISAFAFERGTGGTMIYDNYLVTARP